MKRKFVLGICSLLAIIILFSIFLFHNISLMNEYRNIKDTHNEVLTAYLQILSKTQNALILLYQYKSGFRSEFDSLVNELLKNDELIASLNNTFAENEFKSICSECHNIDEKLSGLSSNLRSYQAAFENALSPVIISLNEKQALAYQDEALREGDKIIDSITDRWFKSRKMNIDLDTILETEEIRTKTTIGALLFVTVGASAIILFIMMRSISNPVNKLIKGINIIQTGKYDSKVDITSNDEFGHIARSLNSMAETLKQSTQERDAASEELNRLNCTLEQRISLKTQELKKAHDNLMRTEGLAVAGTIASSIAHELSTPLSTLMGYCEFILQKIPAETGLTKYLDLMLKEIERCSHIMKGMLNLTRISDDEKSSTDINATITALLDFVSLRAKCANISVKKELDSAIPHIMANGLGLRHAFLNIVINAIESMPDGGEIRVASSLVEADNKVKVTISDTGSGIYETDMKIIFTSFYTTKETGTGLGLPISYAIIKSHNGDIIANSERGKGTTFDVFLPV